MASAYQIIDHAYDVVVVGAGGAGLRATLGMAEQGFSTACVTKVFPTRSHTVAAQGGIAASLSNMGPDSWQWHMYDTVKGSDWLGDQDAIEYLVREAPQAVYELEHYGVPFSRTEDGKIYQRPFGGHMTEYGEGPPVQRTCAAADRTGHAILHTLYGQSLRNNAEFFVEYFALDLIMGENGECQGVIAWKLDDGTIHRFRAKMVVLATGGASKVYLYTSNPDVATGDGIAMAWRAGCRVANMEFMQFHPTCLYHPKAKSFLVTEAIRGEGGHLLLPSGERFMHRFDERGELAPRDVVARAIDHEMKRLGADCLYLDISHKPADFIIEHFPTVYAKCLQLGLDITRDPMPVVPAAHYTCGGVMINETGQTDLPGLYAIGETSFTGLHGANRMASNSLLECMVYGKASAEHIGATLAGVPEPREHKEWDESQVTDSDEDVVISHNWDELRRFMWDYVGIVRTEKRLQRAQHRVDMLKSEIAEYYSNYHISNDLLELRNLVVIAELIILSAMQRKESRGLHFMRDFPGVNDEAVDTVLTPDLN